MTRQGSKRRGWKVFLLGGLTASAGLSAALAGPPGEAIPLPGKSAVVMLAPAPGLGELRKLALEKQPALAAYRASLSAALARADGLEQLRLAQLVRCDFATRKMQAQSGVNAAEGRLSRAEWDTLYAVTRSYLSVAYAEQQLAIANRALDSRSDSLQSLYKLKAIAAGIRKEGSGVRDWNVHQVQWMIDVAEGRRHEALQGRDRALAALREAIGLGLGCPLPGFTATVPDLTLTVSRDDIITLALHRRGELVQTKAAVEATSLEIEAQKLLPGPRAETFASGGDLHAEPVPQGEANGEYRPGAVGIEMPIQLVGPKCSRVDQATHLHDRALAVDEKITQLITLEADDAYQKWVEASSKAAHYLQAFETAKKMAADVPRDIPKTGSRVPLDDLIQVHVRLTQTELQLNEARYHALLALAALERITAGGYRPGFEACK